MLINLEGHKIHCVLRFGFKASNNEAEYEALIVGLLLARELQSYNIQIYCDSQLEVNHIYEAGGDRMTAYLEKTKGLMETFPVASIEVIP